MVEASWVRHYRELTRFLDRYDRERRFSFKDPRLKARFQELRERFRGSFIREVAGRDVVRAREWVSRFKASLKRACESLGAEGWLLSKELKSFVKDPELHLRKKLFNYMYDLLRGRIGLEDFERSASAAVRTSLTTNLRTIYQDWVLMSILSYMGRRGARLIYPEHGYILLERSGRQRSGRIPPNAILRLKGGYLSFFLEAPRPVGWEDSSDLSRAWRLYTALRPDVMVYSGKVMNIARPMEDPPIARPDVIIECKELEDWYVRVRDVRGPFAKPLSAEEWRSKWIRGLWEGLAEVLGVERREVEEKAVKRTLRLKEPQILALYMRVYKPREMYLVSRGVVPGDVRRSLEENGITVVDGVGFDSRRLKGLAVSLEKYASGGDGVEELKDEVVYRVRERLGEVSEEEILRAVYRLALDRLDELASYIRCRIT